MIEIVLEIIQVVPLVFFDWCFPSNDVFSSLKPSGLMISGSGLLLR